MLRPPVELALARDEREVPGPDPRWSYEPKFDGWRAAVFTASGVVQSRRDNDLAARFPEVVAAVRGLGDLLLDGELVALREGRLDFGALTSTPRARAGAGIDIYFIAFDVLADGADDLRRQPYRDRRERLVLRLAGVRPPVQLVPATADRDEALTWMRPELADVGIEGVVAKHADRPYRAGRTGDWRKIRQRIVVDAIVVGVAGALARPEALVLARPDEAGELRQVGLSLPLPPAMRDIAAPLVRSTGEPRRRLPGAVLGQQGTEYQPVHPTLVVEVEAEATVLTFNARLRPRVHRVRTDLTPADVRSSRGEG
jgi:ATP-dependent DNA ligase